MAIVSGLIGRKWWAPANAVGILILALAALGVLAFIPVWLTRRALFRADYHRALLWARLAGPLGREHRGIILSLAGRSNEAEELFRGLAAKARNPKVRAGRLTCLADVISCQGRFDEAREYLDQAMQLDTVPGSPQSQLAEWHLLQGLEPQRALELIDQVIGSPANTALKPTAAKAVLGFRLATKAWALARLGRHTEAEAAIHEAFRNADWSFIPGVAVLHWTAGTAFTAMGRPADAREHFQKAFQIDPHGRYGNLSARCLEEA